MGWRKYALSGAHFFLLKRNQLMWIKAIIGKMYERLKTRVTHRVLGRSQIWEKMTNANWRFYLFFLWSSDSFSLIKILNVFLQVERIDTVEGGGLSVLGLSLHNHCGVALIVFSIFFLLVGLILAVIAFSNSVRSEIGDDPNRLGFLQRNRNTLRFVGPAMLVSGFVMALCGVCFCCLNWKVNNKFF